MSKQELIEDIHEAFIRNEWVFEGYGVPTLEDVKVVVDQCHERLEDKPDGTVIEVGNISLRKDSGSYHFYVRLGDFQEEV